MKKIVFLAVMLAVACTIHAQSVAIGTNTPDSSAQLDVSSTTKGLLIPRMTSLERVAIENPATGLIVYQTTSPSGFYYNTGTPATPNWVLLLNSAAAITNITTSSPLLSSGGTTPNISLPGTSGGILFGTGAASSFTTPGSSGQFLRSNGSSAPTWTNLSLGQTGTSVYGTAGVTVANATAVAIPNLTQTITVPSNSLIYVSTTGGMQCNTTSTTGYSIADIFIRIDGAIPSSGGYQRLYAVNNTSVTSVIENWSISDIFVLTPGVHTISVFTFLAGGNATALVSGNNTTILQGTLTVLILKQ